MNIENIYASQIVEEIRRKREKAQQNVSLKKLLQNKRQQSADNDNEIQKSLMKCMQIKLSSTLERVLSRSKKNNDEENDIYRR